MNDHLKAIKSVVTELETIQQEIGRSQIDLLNVLTDDSQDEWDCPAQTGLLKLEIVQRMIGEVQVLLVEVMPVCDANGAPLPKKETVADTRPSTAGANTVQTGVPAKGASLRTPQEVLEARGFKIRPSEPPTGLEGSADRASLLLGENFPVLEPFYRAVKRRVTHNSGSRWFDAAGLPKEALNDICDFGNRLMASGFFADFKFFSKGVAHDRECKPVILFDPLTDRRVKYFFEGGWLERYAFQVVRQRVQQTIGIWCDQQFARGVKVDFPDGGHGEFDVLVS
ncbi:MAG: hypothetical protein ACREBG_04010, partial [Pyrinomonadaceae bacterium]